ERMRAAWASMENRHLSAAGIDGRVDHRSLKDQHADAVARGDLEAAERFNRPPEPKLRPGEKKRQTERTAEIAELRSYRAEVIDLTAERKRRRQRRHPDDLRAALERPTAQQSHLMEEAHARLTEARQQVTGGAIDGNRRQDRRAHDAAGAAGRQPVESGFATRTGPTAGGAIGRSGAAGGGAQGRNRHDQSPEAIARRRERSRRIEEAKARMGTLDTCNQAVRDRYKLQLLQGHYQQQMPAEIAADLAWVRDRGPANELVVQMRDGGRIRDDGAALRTKDDGTTMKFAAMAAAAKARGWADLEVEVSGGSRAFREKSAEALTRAGIAVKNADLAEVVFKTKQRMAAEAVRDDVAFVEQQLAAAEQRLAMHQRAAWDDSWTGPDGQRRPFTRAVPGIAQPVPARMTDDEIRDIAQPGWSGPRDRAKSLESTLADHREEYANLGALARLTAGSKREEIERLQAAIKQAHKEAAEKDRQWRQLGRQAGELERQADRMRDAAPTGFTQVSQVSSHDGWL
ncbi:MAG: mobL3, partial [Rhodocyclaceae bacterium]